MHLSFLDVYSTSGYRKCHGEENTNALTALLLEYLVFIVCLHKNPSSVCIKILPRKSNWQFDYTLIIKNCERIIAH